MRVERLVAVLVVCLALIVSVLAGASRTEAAASWCEEDPIITIGTSTANIVTRIPREHVDRLRGPVRISVKLPHGHPEPTVTYTANGYFTEVAILKSDVNLPWNPDGPNVIDVRMSIDARGHFPIEMDVETNHGKVTLAGMSNKTLRIKNVLY